jgi:hypothetical protein
MAKTSQFLVVTIRIHSEAGKQAWDSLETTFNRAKDWLRYGTGVYFLFTSQTPRTWYERIKQTPDLPSSFSVLIAPVDLSERSGQNTQRVWDWIKRNIERSTG